MKKIIGILIFALLSTYSFAQTCDSIVVDLINGTVNNLKPNASQAEVKAALPCSTGDTEDGGEFNCGGGVFFLNNDFYFYTGRDFIEFRQKFNGKLSIPILGLSEKTAIENLNMGTPTLTQKEKNGDTYLFFNAAYGCLILKIVDQTVIQLNIYAKQAKEVELCL